jgi:hypothetical protein
MDGFSTVIMRIECAQIATAQGWYP